MINRENETKLFNIVDPLNMQCVATQCCNENNDFYKIDSFNQISEVYKNIIPIGMNELNVSSRKKALTEKDVALLDKYVKNSDFKEYIINGVVKKFVGITISVKVENGLEIDSEYTDSIYISSFENNLARDAYLNTNVTIQSLNIPENQDWVSTRFDSHGVMNSVYFGRSFLVSEAKTVLSTYNCLTPYKIDEIIKMLPKTKSGILLKSDLNRNIEAIYIRVLDDAVTT